MESQSRLKKCEVLIKYVLAHLSRRLIGELIVYEGIPRPSVCQHFQTTSSLKPKADSFHISHKASIGRVDEKLCFFVPNG